MPLSDHRGVLRAPGESHSAWGLRCPKLLTNCAPLAAGEQAWQPAVPTAEAPGPTSLSAWGGFDPLATKTHLP